MYDTARREIAGALRSLRRSRSVAALVVLTLAIGTGVSAAMFTVLDTVLFRPLPFDNPEQIVLVHPTMEEWRDHPTLAPLWRHGMFSPPELRSWLARQESFQSAAGYLLTTARTPSGGGSVQISVGQATPELWSVLRVEPVLGRLFGGDEPEPVVVLTHEYWSLQLGGDSAIVGREVRLDDRPVRVVGVLPPGFALDGAPADLWMPLSVTPNNDFLSNHFIHGIGRLRPRVGMAQAGEETARLLRIASEQEPGHRTHRAYLVPPRDDATREIRLPLMIFTGAAILLLLAACANAALLLLGAGTNRTRELAVRRALGASRGRIGGRLLLESLLLGMAGALGGLAIAVGVLHLLVRMAPEETGLLGGIHVDPHTFAAAAALALVTGVACGCVPAASLSRVSATEALRSGASTSSGGRLQPAIVAIELALATLLLVASGLLVRTMDALQRVEPGFNADGLITMQIGLPWDRLYPPGANEDSVNAALGGYVERMRAAVSSLPGVDAVALTSNMPFSADRGSNEIEPEGYHPEPGEEISVARRFVTGNYFDLLRIRPVQGRALTPGDDYPQAEPVMVVTDAFARHFWPDRRWIDRRVGFRGTSYRIVGVIADTREHDLRGDNDLYKFYVPARYAGDAAENLLIRASLPDAQIIPRLREIIWSVDPGIVVEDVLPMRDRIARSLAADRYRMRLMTLYSVTAAAFALFGVYGVMSRTVKRRRREIGVRMALGAHPGKIFTLVLRGAARMGVPGIACGVVLAILGTRLMERLVWGIPRIDPLTNLVASAMLLGITLLAAGFPAYQASCMEPAQATRESD